ncbi:hypothetical protein CEE44_00190 [Candidatus Woesearchaeota archaeon B3_Woes]|nr:MAG: hypothetical protein CEE44_00190 [Candidatus Woesearchaeota archaeon B3_Woes]
MVSNKKLKRYEITISRIIKCIKQIESSDQFDELCDTLGYDPDTISYEDLVQGEGLKNADLYRTIQNMDDTHGTLVDKFLTEIPDMIKQAHEKYQVEHRIEDYILESPFSIEGVELKVLYSTYSTRDLTCQLEDRLSNGTVDNTDSWFSGVFADIANHFGQFYGISHKDLVVIAQNKGVKESKAQYDIDFFHILTKEDYQGTPIISPNAINTNCYANPSANQNT